MKASASQLLKEAETVKTALADDSPTDMRAFQLRTRLCWLLEELLLTDLEFALDKKAEQELWNCAFRNPISAFQAKVNDKKKRQNGETQGMLSMLLETASGFYLQLLQKLCGVYNISLRCHLSDAAYGVIRFDREGSRAAERPKRSSVLYICQHCLVHLGDIARYRGQSLQAENFYRHAVELGPRNGHPYNQLALLEAASGEKLSTVFFYVRSLALQHPFPAAATNLSKLYSKMLADSSSSVGKTKMTPYEYTTAFLQFNAHTYLVSDVRKAECLLGSLTASLPALVMAEKLETWQLVQMAAVCMFTHEHSPEGDKKDAPSDEALSQDEKRVRSLVLDLISSMLHALLLPMHALQETKSMRDCCTVPVVKLILDWLLQNRSYLLQEPFVRRPQIWHGFCKLLNALVDTVPADFPKESYSETPLPEDWDLQCFLPLREAHRKLRFDPAVPLPNESTTSILRGSRMLDLADELTQVVMTGKRLITVTPDKAPRYTASHYTEAMSNQVMQQIQELSIEPEQDVKQQAGGQSSPDRGSSSEGLSTQEVRFKLDKVEGNGDGEKKPGKVAMPRERRPARNVAMQTILQQKEQRAPQVGDCTIPRQGGVTMNGTVPPPNIHHGEEKAEHSVWLPQPSPYQHNGNPLVPRQQLPYLQQQQTNGRRPPSPPPQAPAQNGGGGGKFLPQQSHPYFWNYLVTSRPSQPPQQLHPMLHMPQQVMPPPAPPGGFVYMNAPQPTGGGESKFPPHADPYQQQQVPQMQQVPARTWLPHGMDVSGCGLLPPKSGQPLPSGSSGPEVSPNTYSLFNSPWPSGLQHMANDGGRSSGGAVDPMVMHSRIQSLWSGPGPSPLERLLEQQKQWRDGSTQ